MRFERRFSADTRLLVVTEGILTARLQSDPLLSDFTTVILDEFHERSIHADLAIALARQAWRARDDLRIVVMSATLESQPVSAFLDGCPVIDVAGPHASDRRDLPSGPDGRRRGARRAGRDRRPGAVFPARRRRDSPRGRANSSRGFAVRSRSCRCTARLTRTTQDLALRPSSQRRVIVATNIAETSLTVPGVTAVIDAGLQKVARYDAERGIDSLETERITADAADQRAGRAGRLSPGVVRRLWDARDRLRPHREAEIHRVDLASTALDVIAWGGDPRTLEWFERAARGRARRRAGAAPAPRADRRRQSAIRNPQGDRSARRSWRTGAPSAAPSASRAHAGRRRRRAQVAQACALLSERHLLPPRTATTSSDLLSALDRWSTCRRTLQHVADVIADFGSRIADSIADSSGGDEPSCGRFLPVTRIVSPSGGNPARPNLLLASGTGATIASGERRARRRVPRRAWTSRNPQSNPQSAFRDPQFARVRMAEPRRTRMAEADLVRGRAPLRRCGRTRQSALASIATTRWCWASSRSPVDPEIAAGLLADAWLERGPRDRRRGVAAPAAVHRPGSRRRSAGAHRRVRRALARRGASRAGADAGPGRARSIATRRSRWSFPAAVTPRSTYQRRWQRVGVREAAGAVRPGGYAAGRPSARAGRLVAARAERPAGSGHARSAQLLGSHVSGGAEGVARAGIRSIPGRRIRGRRAADARVGADTALQSASNGATSARTASWIAQSRSPCDDRTATADQCDSADGHRDEADDRRASPQYLAAMHRRRP